MSTQTEQATGPVQGATSFPTTRWSLVLQANIPKDAAARDSIEVLCRRYWYPIYTYLRRQGHPHHAAEDLTQGFFFHLLTSDGLSVASPSRGRFRSFLLTCLRHYTANTWHHDHAAKRGGKNSPKPLELTDAEGRFLTEVADPGLSPEEAFDRNWAIDLIQQALDALRAEYANTGRSTLFTELLPYSFGRNTEEPQAMAAQRLGLNEHAFTVAVFRFRKRLREHLRNLVADTVATHEETDSELQILLTTLRQRLPPS